MRRRSRRATCSAGSGSSDAEDGLLGAHRFLSSGDVSEFRRLGARLLGPELNHTGAVGAVDPGLSTMGRPDGRAVDELRPIAFERDFTKMADGSCLVSFGETRVLCTASIDDDVPRWMRGRGKGWVTAEYSMLPGSSPERGRPRGGAREAERPDDRDPAADRTEPARGV